MSLVEQAIKYAQLGWSVIPIVPKGKAPPKGMSWKKHQMKKATPDEIKAWWEQYPDANIGIVTGKISNLVVVDFDGADAIERFEAQVCNLPETIVQATGRPEGGKHAFFKYPSNGNSLKSKAGYLEGVDLKATGGYVVVAPSIHPSGNEYQWLKIDPIEHGLGDLLEMPPGMIEFFLRQSGNGSQRHIPLTFEPVKRGERNSTLARIVGKLLANGMDSETIHLAALGWNSKLDEPLDLNEVNTVVESIQETDQRNHPERYNRPVIVSPRSSSLCKTESPLGFPFQVMKGAAGYFSNVHGLIMESPQEFFFMSYLTLLGSVLSPKLTIKSELNTQPRLFTVLLGESATDRKSTAINVTYKHFRYVLHEINASWGIGSAEGLQKIMVKKEDQESFGTILIYDEMKAFVSKCKIDSSVLLPMVNTLFENSNYENHTKTHSVKIDSGYLSMLGASTLQSYERIYTPSFMAIGFPNRVFLVPGTSTSSHPIPEKVNEKDQEIMKMHLNKILQHVGYGLTLDFTPDALREYEFWYDEIKRSDSIHAKRLDTYAVRLMMLLTVNSFKSEIDLEVVKDVIALCNWQFEVRKLHDPVDADNKVAEMEEKIRRHLKQGPWKDYRLKQKVNAHKAGLQIYNLARNNLSKAKEIKFDPKESKWVYIEQEAL